MLRTLVLLTVLIAMAYSILSCTTLPASSYEQSPQYTEGKFRNAAPRQAPGQRHPGHAETRAMASLTTRPLSSRTTRWQRRARLSS